MTDSEARSVDDQLANFVRSYEALGKPPLDDEQREELLADLTERHAGLTQLAAAMARIPERISPAMARSLMATENAWRDMEAEFGLLTSRKVADHLRISISSVARRRLNGGLLAVWRRSAYRYPGFQFDEDGQVLEIIPRLVAVADQYGVRGSELAQWICAPSGYLDGDRSVDHLATNPERVVTAAEGHYGIEW